MHFLIGDLVASSGPSPFLVAYSSLSWVLVGVLLNQPHCSFVSFTPTPLYCRVFIGRIFDSFFILPLCISHCGPYVAMLPLHSNSCSEVNSPPSQLRSLINPAIVIQFLDEYDCYKQRLNHAPEEITPILKLLGPQASQQIQFYMKIKSYTAEQALRSVTWSGTTIEDYVLSLNQCVMSPEDDTTDSLYTMTKSFQTIVAAAEAKRLKLPNNRLARLYKANIQPQQFQASLTITFATTLQQVIQEAALQSNRFLRTTSSCEFDDRAPSAMEKVVSDVVPQSPPGEPTVASLPVIYSDVLPTRQPSHVSGMTVKAVHPPQSTLLFRRYYPTSRSSEVCLIWSHQSILESFERYTTT